ncbi:MAG TPA: aminotransferase class I/II-fold pyridoxal phosphate-dependent enzyme [Candidatus Egerieimonas intestinavium]|uniref:Aminotransferase class I/II-fold pyridoxal phosphate-dependent enzyme n=1 Tax=Candidatus Egerieimonas intestinavium TaxID=2840777 RepID=A0A9D1EH00_9FIRM|nr:aminotransferase class I/II-fold pyridoxal phosphate-dependent enzyme [Candidatus Egerieimonas intestinavium]
MKEITAYSREELTALEAKLASEYDAWKEKGLALNMARGKPAAAQLDLSNEMLSNGLASYKTEDGLDARNYGVLDGIPECKRLFGELLGIPTDQIIIGGNSSLNMMYDMMARLCLFGTQGEKPWKAWEFEGKPVKFLCPSPGYDRHFTICEALGIEMIPVKLLEDGPDMDEVERLAASDERIKGIWCVPLHSNPQGVCYSDQVVDRLASMKTAAADFRIFWDNAYGVHHIYEEVALKDILQACKEAGNENRVYYFFSTSKITFPGAGIALMASGAGNIAEVKKAMNAQTIGHDKLNQLRHVQYFKNAEGVRKHMKDLAAELRPKFDMVLSKLEEHLGGTGLMTWSSPKGGYFVSVDTIPGCAKETVRLAKEAGVTLTGAGATYPYGKDPQDSNIRIAPSFPVPEELAQAMDLFCLCVKLAGVRKLLEK